MVPDVLKKYFKMLFLEYYRRIRMGHYNICVTGNTRNLIFLIRESKINIGA